MPKKVLETTFKADGDLLAYMQRTGAGADQLRAKMVELRGAAAAKANLAAGDGEGGGGLAGVRQQLGARSQLGQLGSILTGGAAVGGVTLLANAVGSAADRATELRKQLDAGKIGAGGVAAGLVQSVPVLGQMVSAFDKVGNALAGIPALAESGVGKVLGLSARAAAQAAEEVRAVQAIVDQFQAAANGRQKKLLIDTAADLRRLQVESAGAGLEGYEREQYARRAAAEEKLADLKARRAEQLATAEADRRAKDAEIGKSDAKPAVKLQAQAELLQRSLADQRRIGEQFDKEEQAQRQATTAEAAAEAKRHFLDMRRLFAANAAATNADAAAADGQRLQATGHAQAAELAAVERGLAEKQRAIDAAADEQLKRAADDDERDSVRSQAAAQRAVAERTAAMARANLAYRATLDAQTDVLSARAASGDQRAAAELKQVQAAREYEQQANRINDVLAAGNVTVEQRAYLERQLAGLERARADAGTEGLRQAQLELLRLRAGAGDYGAAQDAERMERTEKIKALEGQIAAIKAHGDADAAKAADKQLADLKAAASAGVSERLRQAELEVLRARAAAGDRDAEQLVARVEQTDKVRQLEAAIAAAKADGDAAQQRRAQFDLDALNALQADQAARRARDERQAALQLRAEYGATAAERQAASRELAATEIHQQFAARQAAVQAILDDKAATDAMKAQAVADLRDLADEAGRAYAERVGKAHGAARPLTYTFAAEDRGLLMHGWGAAAKDRHDPAEDVARNTAEGNKLTAELLAAMQRFPGAIADAAAGGGRQPVPAVPVAPQPAATVPTPPAGPTLSPERQAVADAYRRLQEATAAARRTDTVGNDRDARRAALDGLRAARQAYDDARAGRPTPVEPPATLVVTPPPAAPALVRPAAPVPPPVPIPAARGRPAADVTAAGGTSSGELLSRVDTLIGRVDELVRFVIAGRSRQPQSIFGGT